MISIILVDDHTLFRQGIASLIKTVEDIEVIAEASTGVEAVNFAGALDPDIIVMDLAMPDMDGIKAAKQIKDTGNPVRIILLSMHNDQELITTTDEFINGYLLKNDAFENLIYAIKAVYKGEKFISASLQSKELNTSNFSTSIDQILSKREIDIITNVTNGHSNKEIAKKLFISVKTVETHRANIMQKLNLKGITDLTKYAIKTGIVDS